MAACFPLLLSSSIFLFLAVSNPPAAAFRDDFSIIDYGRSSRLFRGDYAPSPAPTPPPPPPPSSPPYPSRVSCEDLKGIGSLDTNCELNTSLNFTDDVYIEGRGNFYVLQGVVLICPKSGCSIMINVTGDFTLKSFVEIVAGSVHIVAGNASLLEGSMINVTARADRTTPPATGTPDDAQGGGGGHGGRGASCVLDSKKLPEEIWGGDAYAWESLDKPWSYGSKGGTTKKEEDYGGGGGGRIWLEADDVVDMRGMLLAEGGDGGVKGGGGSGGSIYIKSKKMMGNGRVCASGGNGFAGGGGGRVSVDVFSRHDDPIFLVHGGKSYGCPGNAGAAGTFFDAVPRRLIINNNNMSTDTCTLLLQFPNQPLWTNVYIRNGAQATVPSLWSRIQVRGQLSLSSGSALSFGVVHCAFSEFELMAEELLMSDSIIKVYGALRMSVKIYLMLTSKMLIAGDSDAIVATSLLEASNLVVLKGSSMIHSTANLGLNGQGSLNLTGPGDVIEAQHLVLSLFYAISVGPGSVLRGPLKNASDSAVAPRLYCEKNYCPVELLHPPEDCNVNASLSFTLQICRVEDIIVEGFVEGSVVHFHLVRTVMVKSSGSVSASALGCSGGLGHGGLLPNGLGSGAGHGGRGGDAYYGGTYIRGGIAYGDAQLPCELGSGSGNKSLTGATAGGGIIVMGSLEHSLPKLVVHGQIEADGQSFRKYNKDGRLLRDIGPGGGSGGTILLFLHNLILHNTSTISTSGGHGSPNAGGGGGGRVHFHWADIPVGDEYLPMAIVKGTTDVRGGKSRGRGQEGENGTLSGKACPKGLYGIFCLECPLGTYKNLTGSDRALCRDCPSDELPHRAEYITVRGGVMETPCPYKCISERYKMPHCNTALEELIYTFGGPWLFGFTLFSLLILLALVLSVARMKFSGGDELPSLMPNRRRSTIDRSLPFLESLNEVMETSRVEESETHVHRMYFLGANTFSEPWHLLHSPPKEIKDIVYEDAFNIFVDEINALASYQWWEGSAYGILFFTAYPLARTWLQWRRKEKVQQLREYVRSEYDHACLRSCRSRALYEGLKVAATSDLLLAYVDFFLGGDEKRNDLPPRLRQRFPMSLVFGGDGSYMDPFSLHSDNILTNLMSQSLPPTVWYRLVAGLNAQLRLVRRGHLRATFYQVISWLETHASKKLRSHGIHVDLARYQPSAGGYCQFGLVVCSTDDENVRSSSQEPDWSLLLENQSRLPAVRWKKALNLVRSSEHAVMQKRISGEILHMNNVHKLREGLWNPFYYILRNIRPVCHQDLVGLIISVLLLGDFSLVLLLLLQLYSISTLVVFLVFFIPPFGILLPFPTGINALFSHGPRRSAALARVYALWNLTSVINVLVAFLCGVFHFKAQSAASRKHPNLQNWNISMDESGWWMLPCGLLICKALQARLIDYHVANLEVQDKTLYSSDPNVFWQG